MNRRLLISTTILAVLLVGAQQLFAQTQPAEGQAVRLAYKLAPGNTQRFRVAQKLTGSQTMPGAAAPTPIDADMTSIVRMTCTQIFQDGSIEIAIQPESGKVRTGGKETNTYTGTTVPKYYRIAPSGKILPALQGSQHRSQPDFGSLESMILLAVLPDKPVLTGNAWTAEIPLTQIAGSKIQLNFQLTDIRQGTDGKLATIKQVLSTPINGGSGSGNATAHGSQNGTTDIVFSVDKGRLISAQGTIRCTVSAPASSNDPKGGMSTFVLNSTFSVQTIVEPAASGIPPSQG